MSMPDLSCRKGFHHVVHANNQLIEILKTRGPGTAVDIDNAASRITLDVIGRVGFDKDFHATETLDDTKINRAFDLMTAGKRKLFSRTFSIGSVWTSYTPELACYKES